MRTPISHRILETVATSAPVFQKQGACLPILHPDAGHTARTVTKNLAHAYQFCIPMPGIPSARFSKTGRMPTNFASRFRTCRPHGYQKQGACLPILHPDAGHTVRTVFKNRAHAYQFCIPIPHMPPARCSKAGRLSSQNTLGTVHGAVSRRMVFECKATVGPRMEVVCPQTLTRLNTFSTATRIY